MSDYLLIGLQEVHQEIFKGKNGKPVISFDRFCRQYVKDMRKVGVLFWMTFGRPPHRVRCLCGWDNMIKNYWTVIARREDEKEREQVKGGDAW